MMISGNKFKKLNNRSGFGLMEILILVVVMGIAASVATRWMANSIDDTRTVETVQELEMLANAIAGNSKILNNGIRADFGYIGDIGAFPSNLQALYENPGYATWDGPYLPMSFSQDSLDFKLDQWGQPYDYTGGIIVTSSGGTANLSKKIADSPDDYLLNKINGIILDSDHNIPGTDFADSIDIMILYPDGTGGTVSKFYNPNAAGLFTLDSIPVGSHSLQIIYSPTNDTISRYLAVLPRHKGRPSYRFAEPYFGGAIQDSNQLYLSTTGNATLGGIGFNDEDIINYDILTNSSSMFLDGNTVFSANEDIDAVHILANGNILLSTNNGATIGGLTFDNDDLVEYDTTTGIATMFLDGATLFSASEDINAVHLLGNGHLLLSTSGSATAAGLSVQNSDIFDYDPVGDSAVLVFDGSAIFGGSADINGIHMLTNGSLAISTDASETIGSLSFDNEDIVVYDTSTGVAVMFFDGDGPFGTSNENIDAIHIGAGSGNVPVPPESIILRPNGTGSQTNLASSGCSENWQCVNESVSDDDASRIIRASNQWAADYYNLGDSSIVTGTIVKVTVWAVAKLAMTQGSVMLCVYTYGNQYQGADQVLTTSYQNYRQEWTSNPNTGVGWTWAEIDDLQAGIRLRGQNNNFPAYCTQVYVEVSYTN